ncbi:DUF3000 domain-containing protein [Actinopolymorpha singaporensis]
MAARTDSNAPPEIFQRALSEIRAAPFRPEIIAEEVPAPQRVAPFAAAISADVVVDDLDLASGRLVLLHHPEGHDAWNGTFRCVAYVRAEVEAEMVTDPLLGGVGWSWLVEALDAEDADYTAPSGTVTRVASESFGGMADEPARAELEIRASWTPVDDALGRHALAWGRLLCTSAGLPTVPAGVVPIPGRRVRSR